MLLLFVACLITSPADCRQERMPLNIDSESATACMMQAQPALAEWINSHPKYQISRWRCTTDASQDI
jgi:hypothetical protein